MVAQVLVRACYAVTVVCLCALVLLAAGVTVAWPLTPSVRNARQLVARRLAAVHEPLLVGLPHPDRVGQALVATEDSRFYSEPGVDPIGVLRALAHPLRGGSDPGGATLTQQLGKLLYTSGRTDAAAVAEQLVLAFKLDAAYRKSEILCLYEAVVYFGNGFYGLPAAAAGYFGKAPSQLDWAQASLLAGLVQAPSAFDPLHHLAAARQRQLEVLGRLVDTGVLGSAQASAVYRQPLGLRAS